MIRAASRTDIPELVRCNLSAKTVEETAGYGLPLDKRTFADESRLEQAWGSGNEVEGELAYIFEEDGKVAGYVLVEVRWDAIELDNIDVRGDMQGRGIGKALVRFVEDLAREHSKNFVTLGTSRNQKTGKPWRSYGFWRKMDYSEDGEVETDEGRKYGFTEIRFRKCLK